MKRYFVRVIAVCLCLVLLFGTAPLGIYGLRAQAVYQDNGIITYGSYPQTRVVDEELCSELVVNMPSLDKWKNYGYYYGTYDPANKTGYTDDGSMKPSGDLDVFMLYADMEYKGERYRGVVMSGNRPTSTGIVVDHTGNHSVQSDNGYVVARYYWFKWEPVKWRVLDSKSGLCMSENLIDSQPYQNYNLRASGENYGDSEKTFYCNNYEKSSLRQWLTGEDAGSFLNVAFTAEERQNILVTSVESSAKHAKFQYDNTEDKIFLLSEEQGENTAYFKNADARKASGTDYAKCQGLMVEKPGYTCPYWWIRSASDSSGFSEMYNANGEWWRTSTGETYIGVRPAVTLDLKGIFGEFHKITFDAGNGKFPSLNRYAEVLCDEGKTFTVPEDAVPTREGYVFRGFSVSGSPDVVACRPGDTLTCTKDITYFTIWEKEGIKDIEPFALQYKKSMKLTPKVVLDGNEEYEITYETSNPNVCTVDADGNLKTEGKGSFQIKIAVKGKNTGKQFDTICDGEVIFVWWQWIIYYALFGFIWY